jgi:CHAT domain-containing protein
VVPAPGTARAAWRAGFGRTVEESLQLRQRNGGRGPFDELGPLPGTRDEVEAIAKELRRGGGRGGVNVLLGATATEATLFELAGQARYLHVATHGLADESETASFSALALTRPRSPSAADDGFLTLTDLLTRWGQRLPSCRMVVLSACRTHVGPQVRDEAPHALPIGFLYAGASSVVATQWMVPDKSTAKLMAAFYANIRDQGDRPDRLAALAAAKKTLRAEFASPYHWAGFVYIGSPE